MAHHLLLPSHLLLLASLLLLPSSLATKDYTNSWAAEVPGGRAAALEVAGEAGCSLDEGELLGEGSNFFHFTCHHVSKRSTDPHHETHASIEEHEHVQWAEQQVAKKRRRREPGAEPQWGNMFNQYSQGMAQPWRLPKPKPQQDYIDPNAVYDNLVNIQDPRFPLMWYLNRGNRLDMNVQEAWALGVTGKGVVVTILDDGIEKANPDLVANYDPQASWDVNQNDADPTPRYDMTDSNRHGTRCAGEVSATANNSVCGIGVAYDSRIGGVRMLDGDVTDAVEARSLSLNNQHIDIYSASWGPDDDGKTVDGPGQLASRAFIQGVAGGRGGKGSIFVWASGNGGRDHDNCNCDGYTNSIWTLSVSSATENGLIPWYSEACSSTMATTYSSGSSGERKVITTDLHNGCTSSHTGTSASAPMAAGVVALVLEANRELTWRDVQHITVRTAHVANLRATDWRVNGLGRNYSHSFGYGVMDASAMVRLAQLWTTAPEKFSANVKAEIGKTNIPPRTSRTAKMDVTEHGQVNFLEHVQAHITLTSPRRGDLQIFLTSPAGTKSTLLAKRPHDSSRAGFHDWPFLTVFCWGEQPAGTWQLEIQNDGRYQVELHSWSMTFHGTETDPALTIRAPATPPPRPAAKPAAQPAPTPAPAVPSPAAPQEQPTAAPAVPQEPSPVPLHAARAPNCAQVGADSYCTSCSPPHLLLAGRCVPSCPVEGYYEGRSNSTPACLACYYTCRTCTGPNDYQCSSCFGDSHLASDSGRATCHNAGLVDKVVASSKWYYVLSIGLILNFFVVILLVVYILRRRARQGKVGLLGGSKGPRYSPMAKGGKKALGKTSSAAAFRDYEESSSEVEDFMRPYSDEPEESPTFMKPFKDDEE